MDFIKYVQKRIVQNKVAKGFPLGNFAYDFKKLREEVNEFEAEINNKDIRAIKEEAADVIIFVLGIVEQYSPTIDMSEAIISKMEKNEKRKIKKISENHYEKEEGD